MRHVHTYTHTLKSLGISDILNSSTNHVHYVSVERWGILTYYYKKLCRLLEYFATVIIELATLEGFIKGLVTSGVRGVLG